MTHERMLELMQIEHECIKRDCDRNCVHRDLVQEMKDIEMYMMAIRLLEKKKPNSLIIIAGTVGRS